MAGTLDSSGMDSEGRERAAAGDCAEYVEMTAALRHSEARLRQITDALPARIAYFDGDWVFRYGNRRYAEWFDTTSAAMAGRAIREVIGEKLFAEVEPHVRRALAGEEVSYEYAVETPDGAVVHARSTLVPDLDADGRVQGCFVHAVDITEQRRAYRALAQAQKMEAIGQLAGGLAHDFNNMLAVVIGNLEGLQETLGAHPAVDEFVRPALDAATGGTELIRRLLAFARQQPIAPRPVEVNELVLGMARMIRRSIPAAIAIATASRAPDLLALTDPHQLENALLNLVFNARDAMPNGGELRIECSLEHLGAASAAELDLAAGDYVQIAVCDNGAGMDSATLARVFEPFFTTKKFGRGSGLGLAMVYGFLKQSGGGVRIRSRQAVGTTVAMLLPRLSAPARADEGAGEPVGAGAAGQALAGRLVLLVEDDDKVRDVVRKQLAALGCAVLEAESGHEAADMVENIPQIALVLSDIVMPGGMDGRALARFVRRFRPELPLVLMTGYAEEAAGGREDASVPVLDKPFGHDRLVEVLTAALGEWRTRGMDGGQAR
ncbi:PAS domain-containing sensor histidine kinase [Thauera phenolivorans]|nr:PAS domain-containing sensor histidine kinase [Thauera phenolivorans]